MDLNDFSAVIKIIRDTKFVIEEGIKLHQFVKKNIDKILKVVYHNITKIIINVFLVFSSVSFVFITISGIFITVLRYDIFSSMFLLKMGAIAIFTLLSQGYFYYLHCDYSKDRLKYLQA